VRTAGLFTDKEAEDAPGVGSPREKTMRVSRAQT
jgi:hypothetical protein